MKLTKLCLEKFCVFKKAEFGFSPGINVFIGTNGTGKSHLLKLLYSVLKANEKADKNNPISPNNLETLLKQKLVNVFRPDPVRPEEAPREQSEGLGRLVYRMKGRASGSVELFTDEGAISFKLTTLGRLSDLKDKLPRSENALFIPSRECLAMYDGFVAAYDKRELSFDETYYDLCLALSASPARGPWAGNLSELNSQLEKVLGGRVHLNGGRFYVYNNDGVIEAHMLSEGMRKIAVLFRLLQSQSIVQNGVLFWDEPEANLNPKLVTVVSRILLKLANAGVQIFVATHDYLLSQELSLYAEYRDLQPAELVSDMRFFCMSRDSENDVSIESGDTLSQLRNNPIVEEFAAHYDRERSLFAKPPGSAMPSHQD
jgi:ABC-type transport system involved in cytochrome c biogenesis ATPase subunit